MRQEDFKQAATDYVDGEPDGAQKIVGQVGFEFGAEYGYQYALTHPNWIPVEERLPTKRKDPLVISDKAFIHTTGGHYLSAVYDYQDKQWIDVYNIEILKSNEVTHWMPIVPPQGKEE